MPYVALVSTKLKDDPTFKPPDDAPTIKSALKMYTIPHTHTFFPREVYPTEDSHVVRFNEGIPLQSGTHYDISFYCKATGNVENLRYFFLAHENLVSQGITAANGDRERDVFVENTINIGGTWSKVTGDIYVEKADRHKDDVSVPQFFFAFNGNGGTVWFTDFVMTKKTMNSDFIKRWMEKVNRSLFFFLALLFHMILFLMIATYTIFRAPAPPKEDFHETFVPPASLPPPPPQTTPQTGGRVAHGGAHHPDGDYHHQRGSVL